MISNLHCAVPLNQVEEYKLLTHEREYETSHLQGPGYQPKEVSGLI